MLNQEDAGVSLIFVHIISGFLGVGKTTTLQYLLTQKPPQENWLFLLNEFGKTGLDQALLDGENITVKQVAGGCLCCAALMPFQINLNKIIRFDKPDRIFIEPSGLGHPDQIVELLKQDQYKKILSIQAVATLVDARHLKNSKYREHDIYMRQLAVADILIANKIDLASDEELSAFNELLKKYQRPGVLIKNGELSFDFLLQSPEFKSRFLVRKMEVQNHSFYSNTIMLDKNSVWPLAPLKAYLESLGILRIKGLVRSEQGFLKVNGVGIEINVDSVKSINEVCRLEFIDDKTINLAEIEKQLKGLTLN